jgi:hypothetical protein
LVVRLVACRATSGGNRPATHWRTKDFPDDDGERLRELGARACQVEGQGEPGLPGDTGLADVGDDPFQEVRAVEQPPGLLHHVGRHLRQFGRPRVGVGGDLRLLPQRRGRGQPGQLRVQHGQVRLRHLLLDGVDEPRPGRGTGEGERVHVDQVAVGDRDLVPAAAGRLHPDG